MKRYLPYLIGTAAFAYLAVLSVKEYAWVFVSSDSGGFLAASMSWMVPQTYGYPLYILLGHLLNLFPGNLAAKMTIVLSALPSAITVAMTYLIVLKLTNKQWVSLVSATTLLGAAVFLTESTITKGYALVAMFLTLAYWAYINEWRYRTAIFLGLASAMHMLVATVCVFWLLADRRWRYWLKPIGVYVLTVAPFYLFILYLINLPSTPKFMVGGLNIPSLKAYFSTTGRAIIGAISVFEFPARMWNVGRMLVMSLGLGLIPLFWSVRRPVSRYTLVLLATIIFTLWYVATCLDSQTWTYLSLMMPSVAILTGLGLNRLRKEHLVAVGTGALALITVNGIFLNANTLNDHRGVRYFDELMNLPDDSVVVCEPGPYSLGLFYAIQSGKNLVPLVYPYLDLIDLYGMRDYQRYLKDRYDVSWNGTLEGVADSLGHAYVAIEGYSVINRCFVLEQTESMVKKVEGLTGLQPESFLREQRTGW